MTADPPRLILLEDVTVPSRGTDPDAEPPVRTVRDRRGNHFVLLSVAHYVRLLAGTERERR